MRASTDDDENDIILMMMTGLMLTLMAILLLVLMRTMKVAMMLTGVAMVPNLTTGLENAMVMMGGDDDHDGDPNGPSTW